MLQRCPYTDTCPIFFISRYQVLVATMSRPKVTRYRFDLEADALPPDTQLLVGSSGFRTGRRIKGLFVRGPFPWLQFCVAMKLPGKALGVWALIHHQCWITRKSEVALSGKMLKQCGVHRQSLYRALKDLEHVGLIQTTRQRGKAVRITLVELPEEKETDDR